MVDLPKKKVGIIACSGEEIPEGTVTRLAALKVLEGLKPAETVTICLPLFLAGGEGDRAFAKFYPTIAVDGCELRCAARATEKYSSKPAASVMVRDVVAENHLGPPEGRRRLNPAGLQAVEATAERISTLVDELIQSHWDRRVGEFIGVQNVLMPGRNEARVETCACGSGIPIQKIDVEGREITFLALPLIFAQFREAGKEPGEATFRELMDAVKIYTPIAAEDEPSCSAAIAQAYSVFWVKGTPA